MIRYALACEHGHAFEGWFGSSGDFDDQAARQLLSCPVCESQAVAKQIMAPAVAGTKKRGGVQPQATRAMMMEAMGKLRSARHDVRFAFGSTGESEPALAEETVATGLSGGKLQNVNAALEAAGALRRPPSEVV